MTDQQKINREEKKMSKKEERQKKEQLEALRRTRQSYLDKARECVVYNDGEGYKFWKNAANELSTKIMSINFPDGPKTVRTIKDGELIISMRKRSNLA